MSSPADPPDRFETEKDPSPFETGSGLFYSLRLLLEDLAEDLGGLV